MRQINLAWAVVVSGLLAWPSLAQAQQEERAENSDAPRRSVLRERVLREFDEDGDGRLNEREVDAVRAQLRRQPGPFLRFGNGSSGERERQAQLRSREAELRPEGERDRDAERDEQDRRGRERERRPDAEREPDRERGPEADRESGRARDTDRDRGPQTRGRTESRRLDRSPGAREGAEGDRRPERARRNAEERRQREPRDPVRVERRIRVESDREIGGPLFPRGPIGPTGGAPERNLQPLFGWFDADGDNVLSRREFAELSQFVERRRPAQPDGPADGPRVGRRDRDSTAPAFGGGFRGFGGGGFRGFPDRARRFEGPPRGDRPQRGGRPTGLGRPSRPPRPDGPPDPPAGPQLAPPDAI